MSRNKPTRDIQKVAQKLFREIWKLAVSVTKDFFQWLFRGLLVTRTRQRRTAKASGFVLPTVVLLLLVVGLVIGAILFRTGSRTNQVISERDQQVIYNAATPAIDRAKAKLEYLFRRDDRLPNTVPSEDILLSMLLNDGRNGIQVLQGTSPYIFPGETDITLRNGANVAPAWRFKVDGNNNGTTTDQEDFTVAYSIIFKARDGSRPASDPFDPRKDLNDREKAAQLYVRNGPITASQAANPQCRRLNAAPESGWDLAGTAALRKTFQVNAVVVKNNNASRTITTLEFQQDRELARANKWGAWFRYDMHMSPNPPFRWNGALHTEGSLFLGGFTNRSVQSYLISAPESCLYTPDANSSVSIGRVINPATNVISFAGQIVKGRIFDNNPADATFHIWDRRNPTIEGNAIITQDNDSFRGGIASARDVASMSLDPVVLFTEDSSQSNDPSDRTNLNKSIDSWKNSGKLSSDSGQPSNPRVRAQSEKSPYVDDTYRADDRLGPKPRFDLEGLNNSFRLDASKKNGIPIATAPLNAEQIKQLTNNVAPASDFDLTTLGLDGYWERRARAQGMRIIVGQRLELGNLYGWGGANDPLYPVYQHSNPALPSTITHVNQQRRALRDNLAAVQATVVYHQGQGKPDEPIACISTTAHPGTQQTIDRSKDFRVDNEQLATNFFTGKGTNGWEYLAPPASLGGVWNTAISNLANFAGEVDGAFPPTKQDRVYPQPYLSMWGNFSNLRRAIDLPAANPSGGDSIADQSYRHTAACTMGMLARNMEDIKTKVSLSAPNFANLGGSTGSLVALDSIAVNATAPTVPTSEGYLAAITDPTEREKARLYSLHQQIERDRELGFAAVPTAPNSTYAKYQYQVKLHTSAAPFKFGGINYGDYNPTDETNTQKKNLAFSCDLTANNYFGLGNPTTWNSAIPADVEKEKSLIRLAVSLCSDGRPKFPSLYYLFPKASRGNRNSPDSAYNTGGANAELYITKTEGIGASFTALDPSALASMTPKSWGSWILPTDGSPGSRPNPNEITLPGGKGYVSLLDSVIFDGRELLPIRLLDIDLDLLRTKTYGSDTWLPRSGVIYAFREDAVREDAISRPGNGLYTDPINPSHPKTDATNVNDPKDPTIPPNGISPKAVDFFPDPDRRPYGFRLRNGADVRREPSNPRGLTFISDNTVALQGDFNRHTQQEFTQPLGNSFEPPNFYNQRRTLNENFASLTGDAWRPSEILSDAIVLLSRNFVDGNIAVGFRSEGNHSFRSLGLFANATTNPWIREDGSAADGNQPIANQPNSAIPIRVDRDGNSRTCTAGNTVTTISGVSIPTVCPNNTAPTFTGAPQFGGAPFDNPNANLFGKVDDRRANLNRGIETEINAILVGAVVPTQQNQGNGGIHNFPRLLENWNGIPLKMAGSFIQLNFSTAATGPFEQDLWEPANTLPPAGEQNQWHYWPPDRVWGYDVGLQYAPAGPLSKRFITSQATRSEFYEEPRANDPYICLLRRAIAGQPGTETPAQVNQECQ